MSFLRDLFTITQLTLHEAMRRRILVATPSCGGGFLLEYGIGMHFIFKSQGHDASFAEHRMMVTMITLAGLYAVNFLTVMSAVLLPMAALMIVIVSLPAIKRKREEAFQDVD